MINCSITKSMIATSFTACMLLIYLLPADCFSKDIASPATESVQSKEGIAFVYNPIGLRDPFTPLVQKIRKASIKPKRNLGPLEKFELSQFRLLAMMIVNGNPRAMVKAPDGKSYTVTVDPVTRIGRNSGIVTRIETKVFIVDTGTGLRIEKSPDRVVVQETGIDSFTGKEFKEERYIEM